MKKLQIKIGSILISLAPIFSIISCANNEANVDNTKQIKKKWHFGSFDSLGGENKDKFIERLIKNNITESVFTDLRSQKEDDLRWISFRKKDYENLNKIFLNYSWEKEQVEKTKDEIKVYSSLYSNDRTFENNNIFWFANDKEDAISNLLYEMNKEGTGTQSIKISYKNLKDEFKKEYTHKFSEGSEKVNEDILKKEMKILDLQRIGQYAINYRETKVKISSKNPGVETKLINNGNATYNNNVLKNGEYWENYDPEFKIKSKGHIANKKIKTIKILKDNYHNTPELVFNMDENDELSWEEIEEKNSFENTALGRKIGLKFSTNSGNLTSNMGSKREDGSIYISYERFASSNPGMEYVWNNVLQSKLGDLKNNRKSNGSYKIEYKILKNAKRYRGEWKPFPHSRFYLDVIGDKNGDPITSEDINIETLDRGSREQNAQPLKTIFKISTKNSLTKSDDNIIWKFEINGWKDPQEIIENIKVEVNESKKLQKFTKNEIVAFKTNFDYHNLDFDGGYLFNNLLKHYFVKENNSFEMASYSKNWWNNIEDAKKYIRDNVY